MLVRTCQRKIKREVTNVGIMESSQGNCRTGTIKDVEVQGGFNVLMHGSPNMQVLLQVIGKTNNFTHGYKNTDA